MTEFAILFEEHEELYINNDESFMSEFNGFLEDKWIYTQDWDVVDYLEDFTAYIYESKLDERINDKVSEALWF